MYKVCIKHLMAQDELPTVWDSGWEWPVSHGYKSVHPDGSVGYWPACMETLVRNITYEFRDDVEVTIVDW